MMVINLDRHASIRELFRMSMSSLKEEAVGE
jgi:hypothetical protein